jgi:hypothetical protein
MVTELVKVVVPRTFVSDNARGRERAGDDGFPMCGSLLL